VVIVFRSGVIRVDPGHTVRLDENNHFGAISLFQLSAGISPHGSWAISAIWPVEARISRCYRPGSGIWLVVGWLPC
jgi:hypothetical protein